MTLGVWTDVFTLLIDQFGAADGAEVPPVLFRCRFFRGRLRLLLQGDLRR